MSFPGPLVAKPEPDGASPRPGVPVTSHPPDNPLVEAFAQLWATTPLPFPWSLLDGPHRKADEATLRETIQVLEATPKSLKSH